MLKGGPEGQVVKKGLSTWGAMGSKELRNPDTCPQGCENPLGLEVTHLRLLLVLVLCIKSLCSAPRLKSLESSNLGLRTWKDSASTGGQEDGCPGVAAGA